MTGRAALVMFVVVALGSVAVAQPAPRRDPAADRRADIKRKIRVLRAATLTDALRLDDKTLARLLPVLAKWDDVTEDLLRKRVDIQHRLDAVDSVRAPKVVDKLIDDAVANQKAFWNLEEKRLVELRKILTPGQTARLLIVLPRFERRIQNQLRRALANGAARRRGARRNVEVDDDDDGGDFGGFPQPRR